MGKEKYSKIINVLKEVNLISLIIFFSALISKVITETNCKITTIF